MRETPKLIAHERWMIDPTTRVGGAANTRASLQDSVAETGFPDGVGKDRTLRQLSDIVSHRWVASPYFKSNPWTTSQSARAAS